MRELARYRHFQLLILKRGMPVTEGVLESGRQIKSIALNMIRNAGGELLENVSYILFHCISAQ